MTARAIAMLVCLSLPAGGLLCRAAAAETAASAQAPPPSTQKAPGDQLPTIRVDVDVVNVLCTVKDRKGKLITTLEKNDFEIAEEGEKQQIRYFTRETSLPLTIGLLVDTSVSQARLVPAERDASEVFFRRVLAAKDLAFLISFDTDVDLLQDFTSNQAMLRRALDGLRVNTSGPPPSRLPVPQGPFPLPPRGTLLYDAVYLAANEKLASEVGRKTIVLITDGEDQGSKMKLEQAVEAAQKADVIIYGILFYDRGFYGPFGYSGDSALKKMAEETGGRVFRVTHGKELSTAFEEISQELRSQYSLGYTPGNTRRDGRFRRLRIKTVRDDLRVQARKGYYAPAAQ
jgi:VWFA-related protein